ncbi:hypothetical protein D3C85_1551250 [compost metagenome]
MKYTVYSLLTSKRQPDFHRTVIAPCVKRHTPILKCLGAYILTPPVQRKRLDLRMSAAVILGHKEI